MFSGQAVHYVMTSMTTINVIWFSILRHRQICGADKCSEKTASVIWASIYTTEYNKFLKIMRSHLCSVM